MTRIATLAPFCVLPLVVLMLSVVAATATHAPPRRFMNGKVVRSTCDTFDPFREAKCWACHGQDWEQ